MYTYTDYGRSAHDTLWVLTKDRTKTSEMNAWKLLKRKPKPETWQWVECYEYIYPSDGMKRYKFISIYCRRFLEMPHILCP